MQMDHLDAVADLIDEPLSVVAARLGVANVECSPKHRRIGIDPVERVC